MPPVIAAAVVSAIGYAAGFITLKAAITAVSLAALQYLLTPRPNVPGIGANRPDTKSTVRAAVAPARWVVGRARVGGNMVFYHEINNVLHLAMVLSEGACDSIERVWVNGTEVKITRAARAGSGESGHLIEPESGDPHNGRMVIYEYFKADGTEGDSLRAAATEWTTEHKLDYVSWVHVELTQPAYGGVSNRFWARFPEINFLVKGLKVTWPGQATPVWTESAAAIRYWWLRTRRGIPAAGFNTASFTAAHALCEQAINISLPAGYEDYPQTGKRYAVNGVVFSDDDPSRVEAELDFAWQGWAVEADGVYYFRPGADRAIARAITEDDIVAIGSIQPAPAIQDRLNAATMGLAQSREHDWQEVSIPELQDAPAIARDGETRQEDLGKRPFIADPIAAGRLLAINLRRARASAVFTYILKPGAALEWMGILPSDWVTITDPEQGLLDFPALVTRKVVNEDWSVTLDLVEQPSGVYADTLVLPPLKPREINIPGPSVIPAVTGLAATHAFAVAQDGTIIWHIDITWDDAPYYTRLRVSDEDENFQIEARADGISQRVTVDGPSTYTISAFHVSLSGFASPSASVDITFDWSGVPVPAPVIISSAQYGAFLQIVAVAVVNRDVAGIEVRYDRGPIDGTDELNAIDSDGWLAADRADVALVAPIAGNQPLVANALIPATGRYRLFCRLFNRLGTYGSVVEVGYLVLEVPAINTINPQQWPLWLGSLNNLYRWARDGQYRLLPDYDTPSTLTRDDINGVDGWPFGPIEGYDATMSDTTSTYYETDILDLGEDSNIDVTMDIRAHDPVAVIITRADISTGRVVVATGTNIELFDSNDATPTGSLTSAAGTLDLAAALTIAEIRYDSTNSTIRFDRETADTDDFDTWAGARQGLSFYLELGGVVEELRIEDVTASGDAYLEWGISTGFKTALDAQTAADQLLLMVAGKDQKPLAIVTPEDGHDFYLYHASGNTMPARSTFTQVTISGRTSITSVRYLAARVHLKKWKGLALDRFSPEIRKVG